MLCYVGQIANRLESALRQPTIRRAQLDDAYLCATALLAHAPQSLTASQLGLRLLRDLCAAPLQHMNTAMMRLATFSWSWVSVLGCAVWYWCCACVYSAGRFSAVGGCICVAPKYQGVFVATSALCGCQVCLCLVCHCPYTADVPVCCRC